MSGRRIRIHSLAQARAAVAAAAECGVPVVLDSPPGAAAYWGPALFLAILEKAGAESGVLDCGDAPGHALAALRAGVPAVRLAARPEATAAVAAIAAASGAQVETDAPELLDLGPVPPRRWAEACRAWLNEAG